MVILVYPNTNAARFSQDKETEMHLLAVKPQYRGSGPGKFLANTIINDAKQSGYSKMLLFTQPSMNIAHRLYESLGFVRNYSRDFNRNGRVFSLDKYYFARLF